MKSVICLSLLFMACVSTQGNHMSHPAAAQDDKQYWPQYQGASQNFEVISNFETRHQVSITHLSTSFREAATQRYRDIFHETKAVFEDATDKTGFFVSIYSANPNLQDLKNQQLWNIGLEVNQTTLHPSSIMRLSPKEFWMPFFPTISVWSQEYLILFKLPPINPNQGSKLGFSLRLSAPDGSVRAEW